MGKKKKGTLGCQNKKKGTLGWPEYILSLRSTLSVAPPSLKFDPNKLCKIFRLLCLVIL